LLAELDGVVDVRDKIGMLKAQLAVQADREGAAFFGIDHGNLGSRLRSAFSLSEIRWCVTGDEGDDTDSRRGTGWPGRPGGTGRPRNIEELSRVRVFTQDGRSIDMRQLLKPSQSEAAIAISHVNGERAITVMGKNEGRTVGEIMAELQPRLDEIQADWPAGY